MNNNEFIWIVIDILRTFSYLRKNLDTDMAVDPKTGIAFHPGVTLALGEFFERKLHCYEGYWVVQKKGTAFKDVLLI